LGWAKFATGESWRLHEVNNPLRDIQKWSWEESKGSYLTICHQIVAAGPADPSDELVTFWA